MMKRFQTLLSNSTGAATPRQWIPPHIDNPAFARPFATVSLCSAQVMVLGRGIVWSGVEATDPAANGAGTESPTLGGSGGSDVGGGGSGGSDIGGGGGEGEGAGGAILSGTGAVAAAAAAAAAVGRSGEEASLLLPVGSAIIVGGDAANVYEHAIPPVTAERISLTFRRVMPPGKPLRLQTEATEQCRRQYITMRKAWEGVISSSRPMHCPFLLLPRASVLALTLMYACSDIGSSDCLSVALLQDRRSRRRRRRRRRRCRPRGVAAG